MEKFNKSEFIGIALMMALTFGYMFLTKDQKPPVEITAKKEAVKANLPNQAVLLDKMLVSDSSLKAKTFTIESEDLKITFSNAGAVIQKVELVEFKTYDKNPLVLQDANSATFNLTLPTSKGKIDSKSIIFSSNNSDAKVKGQDSVIVNFQGNLTDGQPVQFSYVVKGKGYLIPFSVKAGGLMAKSNATLSWTNNLKQTENDIELNRRDAKIMYYNAVEDSYSDFTTTATETKDLVEPLRWFSFKQLYFNTGLINKSSDFTATRIISEVNAEDKNSVKKFTAEANFPADNLATNKGNFNFYFGPNEISILKAASPVYNQNVYLGYDLVKPINRFIFVPMFKFYERFIGNYGLLIILVVLTLKLVLTPLVYKSYTSMAKMRVLAPEIEEIKKKVGDDAAKLQQEQMKLYQQVGVSPLSGCVPVLLQMPILMSVFFLFPNMIMFRQKPFLWASDLSTYDAPIRWVQSIPVVGNHLSLFAILYLVSTLAYTYYNNQTTPNQPGPIDMKKLSYIFPVIFFFVLNSFSAALNFYYFVSNIVTILQQLIIRRFVDEGKIRAILLENKTKFQANPSAVKKSKFSKFMEDSMKAAEEAKKQQEVNKKNSPKK